jgi:PhzF family phenazine biosynthesis protein
MKLPLYWVDAFTAKLFHGNPAAVVPLEQWPPDQTMQRIAFENGLAETAFFVPAKSPSDFHLRWFTPVVEVDLCGHATLAAAFTLFTQLGFANAVVTFDSRSGPLIVTRQAGGRLELDFPATPARPVVDTATAQLVAGALGRAPEWLGESKLDLFAVLSDEATVRALRPDFAKVAAAGRRGLIVTAAATSGCDFVSRFFAPQSGVTEDPVTGSAHCALVPYWAGRLGRTRLHGRQISARGGELYCELRGDRVGIAGHAVLYLRGEIEI